MRVIVDTNVFVSGLINPGGAPGCIVDAALDGRITPVFSADTLAELSDVVMRPRLQRFFRRATIEPQALLDRLADIAEMLSPGVADQPIRDPKDRPFVVLATADPPPDCLVTGDADFERGRYGDVPVISASMLARLLSDQAL
ncbi:MAG: putative toxin-antitoxin system toxin component, PIN family [Lamprobacter sp.]|uniref:putative toxin-antitoxin system toxin component, PIN family n=1 Tax=Lamprobacter sp. TaxID=3100796 RepID=UPI002B25767E|nr:putative toxin-antitoxin system toxin component, PIN family [Lamprobacter sp.]MEA3643957.1 putative toxin-antitoxin system toxin component, PIN family [Lamprobacter sp.]